MIVGNLTGFLMFVAAGIVVVIGHFVLKLSDPITMAAAGLALIFTDGFYRFYRKQNPGWFYKNNSGGNLFFLPVWAFGLFVIIANLVSMVRSGTRY